MLRRLLYRRQNSFDGSLCRLSEAWLRQEFTQPPRRASLMPSFDTKSSIHETRTFITRFVGGNGSQAEAPEQEEWMEDEVETAGFDHSLDLELETMAAIADLRKSEDLDEGLREVAKRIAANIASGVYEHDELEALLSIGYELHNGQLWCQGKSLEELINPDKKRLAEIDPEGRYKPMPKNLKDQLLDAQHALASDPEVSAVIVTSPDYQGRNHVQVFTRDAFDPNKIESKVFVLVGNEQELSRFVDALRELIGGETEEEVSLDEAVVMRNSDGELDISAVAEAARESYAGRKLSAEEEGFLQSLENAAEPESARFEKQEALAAVIEQTIIDYVSQYQSRAEQDTALAYMTQSLRDYARQLIHGEQHVSVQETPVQHSPAQSLEPGRQIDRMVSANPMVRMMLRGLQAELGEERHASPFTQMVSKAITDLLNPDGERGTYAREPRAARVLNLLDSVAKNIADPRLKEELTSLAMMLETELERAEKAIAMTAKAEPEYDAQVALNSDVGPKKLAASAVNIAERQSPKLQAALEKFAAEIQQLQAELLELRGERITGRTKVDTLPIETEQAALVATEKLAAKPEPAFVSGIDELQRLRRDRMEAALLGVRSRTETALDVRLAELLGGDAAAAADLRGKILEAVGAVSEKKKVQEPAIATASAWIEPEEAGVIQTSQLRISRETAPTSADTMYIEPEEGADAIATDDLAASREEILERLKEQAEALGVDVEELEERLSGLASGKQLEEALIVQLMEIIDLPTRQRLMLINDIGLDGAALEILETITRRMHVERRFKISPNSTAALAA
jgi:hypothetical protein